MTLLSNSFTITKTKGMITSDPNFNVLNCKVDSDETGTLVPGQAVKIVDATGDVIPVEAAAAVTDGMFGFIPYNFKVNSYVADDMVKVARNGTTMLMEASAAIARGAEVQIVVSGSKVATKTTGRAIGTALDKAAANGDLIRVEIDIQKDIALADISDVTLTSPSNTQVLKYNTGVWVNAADATV